MVTSKPKTFLENGFPVTKLHYLALNEGNSKRPIYQIHKWWARRLGSVFRTLLISSFSKAHETEKELWHKYYNGFSLEDKVIYDPMMGGGTSIVEALRLGCKVIGSDINPVAWFVTKKEIERFDEKLVDTYFQKLEDSVGNKIKKFYTTTCKKGHDCEIVYSIWIRQLKCKKCHKTNELFNNYVIRDDGKQKIVTCPRCNEIFSTKNSNKAACDFCRYKFNINPKIVENGFFTCSGCGFKEKVVDAIKRRGKFLDSKMICIEYECEICGRDYKSPDIYDLQLFRKAVREFKKLRYRLSFPREKITYTHSSDKRPVTHGFKYYYELFNTRQLLALSLLLSEIKKIPDQDSKEFLLITFSSALETNNVLCKYETNWGKISALFGMPAYHVPDRYGENNPWGNGRGSFVRSYLKLKRGKRYAYKSYELIENKLIQRNKTRKFLDESSIADVNRVKLYCRDSRNMKELIKSNTVDMVITDPPYFDTINYSGLADFFYVWLRLVLKDSYPYFRNSTSKRNNEILLRGCSGRGTNNFVSRLTVVLKECKRVLKDDGLLVFTFHHTQDWAWINLRKALRDAGFKISNTHVIRSEGRTGFRKGGQTSYDVCVISRKSKVLNSYKTSSVDLKDYLKNAKMLKKLDNSIRPSDISTIIMSKYIQSNDKTANEIMKRKSEFMEEIQLRVGVKNNS